MVVLGIPLACGRAGAAAWKGARRFVEHSKRALAMHCSAASARQLKPAGRKRRKEGHLPRPLRGAMGVVEFASWVATQVFDVVGSVAGVQGSDGGATVDLQVGKTVFHDVPAKMRSELWLSQLQHKEAQGGVVPAGQYNDLLFERAQKLPADVLSEIDKDTHRTFPGHPRLSTPEGHCALLNVLSAYALSDPEIGYTQGMNFLAGVLLTWLPNEADAFAAFTLLMRQRGLREMYLPDMSLLQIRLWQLSKLLPSRLGEHLEGHAVLPVLYASSWLLTCFAADFPLHFAGRVVDVLVTGKHQVAAPLLKVAVTLLAHCEAALLKMDDFEDMVYYLRQEVPLWSKTRLQELLTDALSKPWTPRQLRVLAQMNGAETVMEAVARVNNLSKQPTSEAAEVVAAAPEEEGPTTTTSSSSRRGGRAAAAGVAAGREGAAAGVAAGREGAAAGVAAGREAAAAGVAAGRQAAAAGVAAGRQAAAAGVAAGREAAAAGVAAGRQAAAAGVPAGRQAAAGRPGSGDAQFQAGPGQDQAEGAQQLTPRTVARSLHSGFLPRLPPTPTRPHAAGGSAETPVWAAFPTAELHSLATQRALPIELTFNEDMHADDLGPRLSQVLSTYAPHGWQPAAAGAGIGGAAATGAAAGDAAGNATTAGPGAGPPARAAAATVPEQQQEDAVQQQAQQQQAQQAQLGTPVRRTVSDIEARAKWDSFAAQASVSLQAVPSPFDASCIPRATTLDPSLAREHADDGATSGAQMQATHEHANRLGASAAAGTAAAVQQQQQQQQQQLQAEFAPVEGSFYSGARHSAVPLMDTPPRQPAAVPPTADGTASPLHSFLNLFRKSPPMTSLGGGSRQEDEAGRKGSSSSPQDAASSHGSGLAAVVQQLGLQESGAAAASGGRAGGDTAGSLLGSTGGRAGSRRLRHSSEIEEFGSWKTAQGGDSQSDLSWESAADCRRLGSSLDSTASSSLNTPAAAAAAAAGGAAAAVGRQQHSPRRSVEVARQKAVSLQEQALLGFLSSGKQDAAKQEQREAQQAQQQAQHPPSPR